MTVAIPTNTPASPDDIRKLENELGYRINDEYRRFLLRSNGVTPESNMFSGDAAEIDEGVEYFVPVADIMSCRAYMEPLDSTVYPIADTGGGDYVVIDEGRNGAVMFWDHETGDLTLLAAGFDAFLASLEPFDPKSVTLDPKSVISVWVHPDLLKEIEDKKS